MKWALFLSGVTIVALLFIAGCQNDGTTADTWAEMIQSFIGDFARQSLAAVLL